MCIEINIESLLVLLIVSIFWLGVIFGKIVFSPRNDEAAEFRHNQSHMMPDHKLITRPPPPDKGK